MSCGPNCQPSAKPQPNLTIVPIFNNALDAYRWAIEVIIVRRGGRAGWVDIEVTRGNGVPKDYAFLDAITIKWASERACFLGCPCPQFSPSCFYDWIMPDIGSDRQRLSDAEVMRVEHCIGVFEEKIAELGYISLK